MKFEIRYIRTGTGSRYELCIGGECYGTYRSRVAAMVALEDFLAVKFCNDHTLSMTVKIWN